MKLKKLKIISSVISASALVGVFSLVVFSNQEKKRNTEEVQGSFYFQNVNESNNTFTIFGNVNNINESYFVSLPSYDEDEDYKRFGTNGDYYININTSYEDNNAVTRVSLQYKLKSIFYVCNGSEQLEIVDDIYNFNGDFVTAGTNKIVGTNKIIDSITLRQYYLFIYDLDVNNNSFQLGLNLYFRFTDNTTAGVSFDYLEYTNILDGSGYENSGENQIYNMDYINVSQSLSLVQANTQSNLDSYYNEGYDIGYNNGFADGVESSQSELTDTYNDGYSAGYTAGYNADSVVSTIFSGIIQVALTPVNFFLGIFNFNILGINLRSFIQALFTVAITVIVVKSVIGGRGGSND